ncbi:glycerophosphodiester phosphodiesterase [Tianweitania sediminis]|uniref:Glycerophosphodiester phosphodiesterase n=1 Tax=Tianweitania sediminis TaxID=1502156 RepID=A0A8J7R9J4_9HYPH|nr:glycerophosphodiester phosphodiesterase [Tianweitania sediminis]MBP0440817.1 glycerophosphodiester phosphodiesterase [Tianweitania sediminis]
MKSYPWLTARPIAHRGYHDLNKSRWENTLSAFKAAIDRNYAIECDVHLSADGVPIVFHDDELKRLAGAEGFIYEKTAAELSSLRIGGTDDYPPTLAELLQLTAGRVPLVIELKGIQGRDAGLVEKVADQLNRYSGEAAIMSFDHWLIRDFKRFAPDLPRGLTAWGEKPDEIELHFTMLAHEIDFVSYHWQHLPNPFITFVRQRLAMPVITWTVRDEEGRTRTADYADQMTFEGFEA